MMRNNFSKRQFGLLATTTSLALVCLSYGKPMDLQMGARGLGMGGAFTSIANDASASYWNPAGLAGLRDLTLSESNWLLPEVTGVNVNQITAAIPTEVGTLAGSWLLQYASLESGDDATYSEKGWMEHHFSLSGGRKLWDKLAFFENTSVGITLNRYLLSAGDQSGAGTGFDLGLQTGLTHGISLGLMARALGADMMGDKVSPAYRIGLGWQGLFGAHGITVAADVATKDDIEYDKGIEGVSTNWKGFGGLEYAFMGGSWSLAVRGGANSTLTNSRDVGEAAGGLGVKWNGFDFEYAYSYPLSGDLSLGQSHRVTLEFAILKLFGSAGGAGGGSSSGSAAHQEQPSGNSQSQAQESTPAEPEFQDLPNKM
jgi:hypothetical protein